VNDNEIDIGIEAPDMDSPAQPEPQDDQEDDVITEAFFGLVSDVGMEFLWDVIGDMVDNGEIEDVPEEGAAKDAQAAWLQQNMGKVSERFKEELNGDPDQ
jgi:hypothetical protein